MRISPTSATNKQIKSSAPNPSLPNDLLLTCFARVSRLYYPTLSLVSKSFQTLVVSPELYKTRSFLNRKENCLYVCLKFPPDPNRYWFTPCRKPNQTLAKKKTTNSSGSHMWREAPCMRMKRNYPTVNVVDGKIYVAGGLEMKDFYSSDSSSWMEVFDPNTQSWEPVWCPLSKRINLPYRSAAIEGEIYMVKPNAIGVSYKPKEDKWGDVSKWELESGWDFLSYCVIDNVLYSYHGGRINWFDFKKRIWRALEGLEGLPKIDNSSTVKLADYGGKLVVLWDKYLDSSGYKEKMIWCAEISLQKRNDKEIWGEVEWFDAVLTVPKSYTFICAESATV
ncbi:F-box/kelch-repeat protein At5g49000 [Capsella rubella]|uniref:F-box/kelch-repeat protein At5g49000 n=1 Tax=Capsella rubella TaxID=81985 RepID=UPI000CD558C6|nr:F-box/kelch-repeat protein At5g49000 [Capsella rubella]